MKLTLHTETDVNLVRAYEPGALRLRDRVLESSVLLSPSEVVCPWQPGDPARLEEHTLAPLLAWEPDICILGTGARQIFPPARLIAALAARGIGLEVMHTPAAVRTYNVLVVDGREVAAALIL